VITNEMYDNDANTFAFIRGHEYFTFGSTIYH